MGTGTADLSVGAIQETLRVSKRLTALVWRDRKWLVAGVAVLVLAASALTFGRSGAHALLINELVRSAGSKVVSNRLAWLTALVIAATLVPPLLLVFQNYVRRLFAFYLEEKFSLLILKKKGELDIATHEDPRHSNLISLVGEHGATRAQQSAERQFGILQNVVDLAMAAVVLVACAPWMLAVIVAGTIPELFAGIRYARRVWGIYHGRAELRRSFTDLSGHFGRVPLLTELKLFQNTGHFLRIVSEIFTRFQAEERRNERRQLAAVLLACALSEVAMAGSLVWFLLAVVRGEMLVGTFWFVTAAVGGLRMSLFSLFHNLGDQYQSGLFVADLFRFLDLQPAIVKPAQGVRIEGEAAPVIAFENVSFAYPGTTRLVLRNLSLTIQAGEKVAVVGLNGAGKTTLLKLLCRFYGPSHGRITIDGHDLRSIDLDSWHRRMGALFQEFAHYHFPAEEAIALGDSSSPLLRSRVFEAAVASESDSFIDRWPDGYRQMLGAEFSGGTEPSIGQWQKLALARVFYRDPAVLVLDEPTASMDAQSEARVFERLAGLSEDKSVILIAHRFSTVRQADRICVLEDGRIKEYGTHTELLEFDGTYARLFSLQARAYA